ncbi:MAG: SurA N-terminal domain-containing protein [Azospirillaceae bacterium]
MIQFIRGKVGSWFVKILFVLLIVAFGAWGIGDMLNEDVQDPVMASVGEVEIGQGLLSQRYQLTISRLSQQTNGAYSSEQARADQLYFDVLDDLVDGAAIAQYIDQLGLTLSDDLIAAQIRGMPQFHNPPGRFDRQTFLGVIASQGYSEAAFIQQMRSEIARSILALSLNPGNTAPRVMTDLLARERLERRSADLYVFEADPSQAPQPSDSELRSFYQANQDRFLSQERRTFTYLYLGASSFRDEVSVSDEVVRAYYEDNAELYTTEERRRFVQVVLGNQETAQEVAEAARGGMTLEEAVASVEGANAEVQEFDWQTRTSIPSVLSAPIFSLEEGEVGEPFQGLGWHVVRVTAVEPPTTAPFEAVAERIRDELEIEPALDLVFELANEVEDELASGATLEDAATAAGLEVSTIGPVAADGQFPDGGTLDIANATDVLSTVFALEQGESSLFEEIAVEDSIPGDVAYYAVRLESIDEPTPLPFETVRPAVALAWSDAWAIEDAHARAEDALDRIGAGWIPSAIAAGHGATLREVGDLGRDGTGSGLPQPVRAAIFATPEGEASVVEAGEAVYIASVTDVVAGGGEGQGDAVEGIADEIAGDTANTMLVLTRRAIRDVLSVTVNADRVESVFQGG